MKRVKALLLGSMALMSILLAFGCSLLGREEVGPPSAGGWYIRVQVQAPGSKGITVTDFPVTGLNIQVRDPAGELLQSIDWAAAEGPQSYAVPVSQLGQYEIEVTHFGVRNGEVVQASESAAFNIQAMKITVIDIVPGCIGVIRVAPGQTVEPQPGTITGRLTGAGAHDGYEFHVPVFPAGAEVDPDNLLGVWSGLLTGGTAEALVRQPPEFVDPLLFGAGQLCDVYGFIDLDGDEVPSKNDWWAGPKTVRVDGDMLVDFSYPVDFEQLVSGFPSTWKLWGTWANEANNDSGGPPAKLIYYESGSVETYRNVLDTTPFETLKFSIAEEWTNEQSHWFKGTVGEGVGTIYTLSRISGGGNTLEFVLNFSRYPEPAELDPSSDYYAILYR